jgi:hypothetical protein
MTSCIHCLVATLSLTATWPVDSVLDSAMGGMTCAVLPGQLVQGEEGGG